VSAIYPQYRIVTDRVCGYSVEVKRRWWWPWTRYWPVLSTSSVESAEKAFAKEKIAQARKIEVVKYLPADAMTFFPFSTDCAEPRRANTSSLWCRIFGHKWWVRTHLKDWVDPMERRHRDTTIEPRKYCDRCGAPNPNWTE